MTCRQRPGMTTQCCSVNLLFPHHSTLTSPLTPELTVQSLLYRHEAVTLTRSWYFEGTVLFASLINVVVLAVQSPASPPSADLTGETLRPSHVSHLLPDGVLPEGCDDPGCDGRLIAWVWGRTDRQWC